MAFGKTSTFLRYDFVNFRPIGVISVNNGGGANTFAGGYFVLGFILSLCTV